MSILTLTEATEIAHSIAVRNFCGLTNSFMAEAI